MGPHTYVGNYQDHLAADVAESADDYMAAVRDPTDLQRPAQVGT